MKTDAPGSREVATLWECARAGDFRAAATAARAALARPDRRVGMTTRVELHLVAAFCSMRQGQHGDALREPGAARRAARARRAAGAAAALRIDAWDAELAYFQGRYSDADATVQRVLPLLERSADWAYAAFALRIAVAIRLARADCDGALALADRAIRAAEASGDDYVSVQILNILGAVHFERATSKLRAPHAHAHLSSLDPTDTAPMESDAREALRLFERARSVAVRAHYEFAAWYVAGNIERLEILLGHADRAVGPIRKRLGALQERGATYDEIVARSNLAWGLRTLGRHQEALQELDAALRLARATGTSNVLLEFLEHDRSIVLGALGETAAALASYRRYVQLVGAAGRGLPAPAADAGCVSPKRPLKPFFLKRADRYIVERLGETFTIPDLARHCGVSWRTLDNSFKTFRGIAPVVHVRNIRLDHARQALIDGRESVAQVAASHGFRSSTTFALAFRKRFGTTPCRARRELRGRCQSGLSLRQPADPSTAARSRRRCSS